MKIIMALLLSLSATAFAQTSTETHIEDGNYLCLESETSGVNFKVNFATVNQIQVLTMTEVIPYGGYVCDWFCDYMSSDEVPYVMKFKEITNTANVNSYYHRTSPTGAGQVLWFYASERGLGAFFKGIRNGNQAFIMTRCNLIP